MSIWQIIFLSGAVSSFVVMAIILARLNRRETVAESVTAPGAASNVSLSEILAMGIVTAATDLVFIFKRATTTVYLFSLLFGRRLVSGVKKILLQVENHFSGLIATVHGRNHHAMIENRRGAVSFFLEQIKIDKRR